MEIDGKKIGQGYPTYVIAEMSANHNQEFDKAVAIIYAAKKAGADAVKLQTYTPDTLVNKDSPYYELYTRAYMPWDWQPKLKKLADKIGITLFSTAYDKTSVDFLEKIDMPAYKIASFELTDLELIQYIGSKDKPIILSTGMATFEEINRALLSAFPGTYRRIALLKCTSTYPTLPEDVNLLCIRDMRNRFSIPVGLSNHCLYRAIPIAAVALGASIIEQHLTLSKSSTDGAFSLLPDEFSQMVQDVRTTEKALGSRIGPTESEKLMLALRRNPRTGKRGGY